MPKHTTIVHALLDENTDALLQLRKGLLENNPQFSIDRELLTSMEKQLTILGKVLRSNLVFQSALVGLENPEE